MGLNAAQILINKPEEQQTVQALAVQNLEALHESYSGKPNNKRVMGLKATNIVIKKPEVQQIAQALAFSGKHSNVSKSNIMNWRAEKEGRRSSFMSDMLTNHDL